MTVDEELNMLDESVRRLKVEYDVYFGGGSKKPPADTEWRVQSLIKKFSDSAKLNFAQRFKYNSITQRYALFSDLWRQKMKIKEEGYRRPQDAVLGIAGMRHEEERAAEQALEAGGGEQPFKVACSDVEADHAAVKLLFEAMMDARKKAGQPVDPNSFDSFKSFVSRKTEQLRKEYGCHGVEYSVEMKDGQVKLTAKAKV
ncbi:MAG: MXAN_5187 C-terminal domain-containing protein [Terriglobales bacterium]